MWTSRYDGGATQDRAFGVTRRREDEEQLAWLVGETSGGAGTQALLAAFDSHGSLALQIAFTPDGMSSATALAVTATDKIVAVGGYSSSSAWIAAFDIDRLPASLLWTTPIPPTQVGTSITTRSVHLISDPATGWWRARAYAYGDLPEAPPGRLYDFDSNGQIASSTPVNLPAAAPASAYPFLVGSQRIDRGDVIAASSWDDGNAIALLQARDDTGAALWDTAITSDEDARIDVVGLAVDADDSYYLLLQSDAAGPIGIDIMVVKTDASGLDSGAHNGTAPHTSPTSRVR
ncbi:MAG: hypothetical protein IPK74_25340 [Deltaproteobacteria bacterium]|nr:hypothetical protein [Deltaproteobacteria bacterium]